MFSKIQITGKNLPPKTLCLTFDDGPGETPKQGPGPKTLELAKYLNEQNIAAIFFVVGKFAKIYPHILCEIIKLGHIIGNHTYSHQNLVDMQDGRDIISEISRTDNIISKFVNNNTIYFRSPYGVWSSDVCEILNVNLAKASNYKYIGPYHWDIDGSDWNFWLNGLSAEDCAKSYLQKIIEIDHGIILMHDSKADIDKIRENNLTYETIKILIPQLKKMGYTFIRLDKMQI